MLSKATARKQRTGNRISFFFSNVQNKADEKFGRIKEHHFIFPVEKALGAQTEDMWEEVSHEKGTT